MGQAVRVAGKILGLSLVFAAILLATTLAFTAPLAYLHDQPVLSADPLTVGVICSLILWLFVAVFHLGRDTLGITVQNADGFLDRARQVMKDLGYDVVFQGADLMLARPNFHSFLFGGGIHIRLDGANSKIIGPKVMAELVRRRLRMQNHLDRAQQSIQDQRRRTGSRLLKRVQITLKLKPHQIDEVQQHVVAPLMEEGNVICMLTILAQSDKGIREIGPDSPIRAWLDQQGLKADFQRDHVELSEPLQTTPCHRVQDTMTGAMLAKLTGSSDIR